MFLRSQTVSRCASHRSPRTGVNTARREKSILRVRLALKAPYRFTNGNAGSDANVQRQAMLSAKVTYKSRLLQYRRRPIIIGSPALFVLLSFKHVQLFKRW
jgi:hypothetical protein